MNGRVRRVKFLTVFVTILSFTILYHSPGRSETSFFWPMFMPAITGGGCNIDPLWSAYTKVCCEDSSIIFSVTISGKTKRSTKASCALATTWDGWEGTTAGTKSVFWQVTSPTCGTYSGALLWIMEKGKYYGYQLELGKDGLVILVYSWNACSVAKNTSVTNSLQKIKEIKLDIPLGAFSQNSMAANSFQIVR